MEVELNRLHRDHIQSCIQSCVRFTPNRSAPCSHASRVRPRWQISSPLSYLIQARQYPLPIPSLLLNPVITLWNSQPTFLPVSLAHTMAIRLLARRGRRAEVADFMLDLDCLFVAIALKGSSFNSFSEYSCSIFCSKDADNAFSSSSSSRRRSHQIPSRTLLLLRTRMRRRRTFVSVVAQSGTEPAIRPCSGFVPTSPCVL